MGDSGGRDLVDGELLSFEAGAMRQFVWFLQSTYLKRTAWLAVPQDCARSE
jgi:hypothetical protein